MRIRDLLDVRKMPRVTIALMASEASGNDPFYARIVDEFYEATRQRHDKFPLVRNWQYGVALCVLPATFDDYFMAIEAAGRRNFKKAERLGYRFGAIDYNGYLGDIGEIRRSTGVRQGKLSDELLAGEVTRCANPPSRNRVHDYPYFGVTRDGRLYAYAGCFIAGELCLIEHILGHAAHQADGVVPMLIVGMAKYVMQNHPRVKYYAYGTYFGAGTTLRRFKRKFLFLPHKVTWVKG